MQLNPVLLSNEVQDIQTPVEDYSVILRQFGLEFKAIDYYLQVGEILQVQGWILHISVIKTQVADLLTNIVPVLITEGVPFKAVKDKETARCLLEGGMGYFRIGKIITVYPETEEKALDLAYKLIPLTEPFRGPVVLTDIHLGGLIYTRYGAFNPVVMSDASGRQDNFIYNGQGELVRDDYNMPFILPPWAIWPFDSIKSPVVPAPKKILKQLYKPVSILKDDAKGRVFKALYLKYGFLLKWCVIKEGKKNMWADDDGRDMTDRILWQHQLHNELSADVPVPKVLDMFSDDEDVYLVMEYIKGVSLSGRISDLNNNCDSWQSLQFKKKQQILDYLLQLIEIVSVLHNKGYVHRDVTPANFMVRKNNRLVVIDNELAYSTKSKTPLPPYTFGTHGYMSLEQMQVQTPTTKEDIYGLGATMINMLIGLSPALFSGWPMDRLQQAFNLLIADKLLAEIIARSISADVSMRPDVTVIKNAVNQYRQQLLKKTSKAEIDSEPKRSAIEELVKSGIKGLSQSPVLIVDDLWLSKIRSRTDVPGVEATEFTKYGGLREGIAGVLYFLARAKRIGFSIDACDRAYQKGFEYIRDNHLSILPNIAPGLYGGAAGIALALCSGIEAGLLPGSEEHRSYILQCLELPLINPTLATGVAGQGVAALQCSQYIHTESLHNLLKGYIDYLITLQHKTGDWLNVPSQQSTAMVASSLGHGNTGITSFLLECAQQFKDLVPTEKIIRSLDFLTRHAQVMIKHLNKYGCCKLLAGEWQPNDSITGLIITFIKAYEVLRVPTYKQVAEDLLMTFPRRIVHDNFTQDTGLAGLGELYLEAFRVLSNPEWQFRADWIATFFLHTSRVEPDGSVHWLLNNWAFATADLAAGNSGILHFLIRYLAPEQIGYRVLN